jgi:hypothetical protein
MRLEFHHYHTFFSLDSQSYVCDFCNSSHRSSLVIPLAFKAFADQLNSCIAALMWKIEHHANESDIPISAISTLTPLSLYNYTQTMSWVRLPLALVAQLSGNGLDLKPQVKVPSLSLSVLLQNARPHFAFVSSGAHALLISLIITHDARRPMSGP